MEVDKDLWLDHLDENGRCSFCTNTGIKNQGKKFGIREFCICPNARIIKNCVEFGEEKEDFKGALKVFDIDLRK